MRNHLLPLCLSIILLMQGGFCSAQDLPKVSFYEKAGWLDVESNTLRRVAELGERGAYSRYKNPNPAPRNAYEEANIHAANLNYLGRYTNFPVYRSAKAWRDAFLSVPDSEDFAEEVQEQLPAEARAEIRQAAAELMALYHQYGDKLPMVAQSTLEVSAVLLPLQKEYFFFSAEHLLSLRRLYQKILTHDTACSQGEGYRLFCEGRLDALRGFVQLAATTQDGQLIEQVLLQDLKTPLIAAELPLGASALLFLGQEERLDSVLAEAVDKEGETFWQKIDVFMVSFWINKIKFSQGRYLGNVSSAAVLPQLYGQADGNAWEELAYLLYNEGRPTETSVRLLSKYGLGACQIDLFDYNDGHKTPSADGHLYSVSVDCKTPLPFLTGVLASGFKDGADEELADAARRVRLSPASFVARLYFENTLGDLNAPTELYVDQRLYSVFEREMQELEKSRQEALVYNQELEKQIKPLRARLQKDFSLGAWSGDMWSRFELEGQIADLERQKRPVPVLPQAMLEKYDEHSRIYQRKEIRQKVFSAVSRVAAVADMGLGIYYMAALPKLAVGLTAGTARNILTVKRGLEAVRAGRVTADVRQLARLSARLKKLRLDQLAKSSRNAKAMLKQEIAGLKNGTPARSSSTLTPAYAMAQSGKAAQEPVRMAVKPVAVTENVRETVAPSAASASGQLAANPAVSKQITQLRELESHWTGITPKELLQRPEDLSRALREARQHARLSKELNALTLEQAAYKVPEQHIFSRDLRQWLSKEYCQLLRQKIDALPVGSSIEHARLSKELKAAIDMADEFSPTLFTQWKVGKFPAASSQRARLKELKKQSSSFSALQHRELAALERELYSALTLPSEKLVELQSRLVMLPELEAGPNTIFLWGSNILPFDVWNRKTILGFTNPRIFKETSVKEAFSKGLKAGEENVVLVHMPGSVNLRRQVWRGLLNLDPSKKFIKDPFTAEIVLQELALSGSKHTSVFVHDCFSGKLLDDVFRLSAQEPGISKTVDWYVSAGILQHNLPDEIPAFIAKGGVKERLFGKLLHIMRYNGDTMASRMLINGKDIYPLQSSIMKLEQEIAAASAAQRPALQILHRDLSLLEELSAARSIEELQSLLLQLELHYPGQVRGLMDFVGKRPFDGFSWGLHYPSAAKGVQEYPFIQLKEEWVNYVSKTAEELFSQVIKESGPAGTGGTKPLNYTQAKKLVQQTVSQTIEQPSPAQLNQAMQQLSQRMQNMQNAWPEITMTEMRALPDAALFARVRAGREYRQLNDLLRQGQTYYNQHFSFGKNAQVSFLPVNQNEAGMHISQRVQMAVEQSNRLQRSFLKQVPQTSAETRQFYSQQYFILDELDAMLPPEQTAWTQKNFSQLPAMRRRLAEFASQPNLSAWQKREITALKRELYHPAGVGNAQKLQLQLRMGNLPYLEKTPNTVWVRGAGYTLPELWDRKTILGFRPAHVLNEAPPEQMLTMLRPHQENVILANLHGYISHTGQWKGTMAFGPGGDLERPACTFNVAKAAGIIEDSNSAFTSVYVQSCHSGGLFQDLKEVFKGRPALTQKTAWFTPVARMQFGSALPVPELSVLGSVQEKLFFKLLQKIEQNGEGLGGRAWVAGKDIYPLRASVRRLAAEMKTAPVAEQEALRVLHEDLKLLLKISDAQDGKALLAPLAELEARYPGSVINLEQWLKAADPANAATTAAIFRYPDGFRWGVRLPENDVLMGEPFVYLKPLWVDYVSKTAQNLFSSQLKKTPYLPVKK